METLTKKPCVGGPSAASLPLGRRVRRGHVRWYLLRIPEGTDWSVCERIRERVGRDILHDVFVPRYEKSKKCRGEWQCRRHPLFRGLAIAATDDPHRLGRELGPLAGGVDLVRPDGRWPYPVSLEAQEALSSLMGEDHVVPSSVGEVVNGALRVLSGPLVGMEDRIVWYHRYDCDALLRLGEGSGAWALRLGLEVPVRRDG